MDRAMLRQLSRTGSAVLLAYAAVIGILLVNGVHLDIKVAISAIQTAGVAGVFLMMWGMPPRNTPPAMTVTVRVTRFTRTA